MQGARWSLEFRYRNYGSTGKEVDAIDERPRGIMAELCAPRKVRTLDRECDQQRKA